MWLGFLAFAQHAALLVVALAGLAASPFLNGETRIYDQLQPGAAGSFNVRKVEVPVQPELADLLHTGLASTSILWLLLALGLMAVAFAIRRARHRLASQVVCVLALPLAVVGLVQQGVTQPCGVLGALAGGLLYVATLIVCGVLAYRLGQPDTRAAFDSRADVVEAADG